jgi:hypothetical protein
MRIFLSAVLVFATACSTRVAAPCVDDSACASGNLCVEGRCAEAPADAGAGGDSCTRTFDCPAGQSCIEGSCRGATVDAGNSLDAGGGSEACRSNDDCEALEACYQSECVRRCFNDRSCERQSPGMICIEVEGVTPGGICVDPECRNDDDCPGEANLCREGHCVQVTFCAADDDCEATDFCNDEGQCEGRDRCMTDDQCGETQVCLDGRCHEVPTCDRDGDGCPPERECVAGRCIERICRSNEDCAEGQVCTAGECTEAEVIVPDRVLVVTPFGACDSGNATACRLPADIGSTFELRMMALDVNGNGIAGLIPVWASSAGAVASVNGAGQLEAIAAGSVLITVTAGGVESRPLTVTVAPAALEDRLRLVDQMGRAVSGASVAVNGVWQDDRSDADGYVTLTAPATTFDLSAVAEGYDQLVLVGIAAGAGVFDATLVLPVSRAGTAAGFTASVNFAGVHSEGGGELSISGASISDVLDFDLVGLIGDVFTTELNIPGLGQQSVPMAGGLTFAAQQPFPITVKDTVYARGAPGVRSAWSFGGRVSPLDLIGQVQQADGIADIVLAVFPLIEHFDHGMLAGLNLSALPMITDADDIDGDGDRAEQVPNWDRFPARTLRPNVVQNGRTEIVLPGAADASGSVITGGVYHPGVGFVPLGLTARDGDQAERFMFRVAPAYGGLEGSDYVFAALAMYNEGTTTRAQILRSDRLETRQAFGAHLPLPNAIERSRANNQIILGEVAGAHLVRAVFSGVSGGLVIFANPAAQGNTALSIPVVPGEVAGARLDVGSVEAIALDAAALGNNEQVNRLASLLAAGQITLRNVSAHAAGFVRQRIAAE